VSALTKRKYSRWRVEEKKVKKITGLEKKKKCNQKKKKKRE